MYIYMRSSITMSDMIFEQKRNGTRIPSKRWKIVARTFWSGLSKQFRFYLYTIHTYIIIHYTSWTLRFVD